MDKEFELAYLEEVKSEIKEELDNVTDFIDKGSLALKGMKSYINENYGSMDVMELTENVNDTNAFAQMMEGDLAKKRDLSFLLGSPYFGKVVFKQNDKEYQIYIGTAGFWSEKTKSPKVFDWRAPVSSLFYDFEQGPASYSAMDSTGPKAERVTYAGDILEKCQFKIEDGHMLYLSDTNLRVADDLLLMALSSDSTSRMKPVVATIQKEQNAIIRDNTSKILVVDGRAGSGKSVVAMHRLAWLLYNNKKKLNTGNVLVISPNTVFTDYVSGIMPELCEDNVPSKQWDDLMDELILSDYSYETKAEQANVILATKKATDRFYNINLKTSIAFFQALEAYLDQVIIRQIEFRDFHYEKTTFTAEKLEKMFYGNFGSLPAYERFYNIAYFIMDEYINKSGRNFGKERCEKIQKNIQYQLISRFAQGDLLELYKDFLSTVAMIYPGADQYENEEGKICYEDLQILFYLQLKLYGCKSYSDTRHVVVDEMQDYSVFQYKIMEMLFNCPMTILGDRYQLIMPVDDVVEAIKTVFPEAKLRSLKTSYRQTKQINDYCNSLLDEDTASLSYERQGEKPEIHLLVEKKSRINKAKKAFEDYINKGYKNIAILADDDSLAYELFRELDGKVVYLTEGNAGYHGGACVMSRFIAKGMEFDAVIVVTEANPDRLNDKERGAFYIACTRALHRLTIIGRKG